MAAYRPRHRGSAHGRLIGQAARDGNRMPWQRAALLCLLGFVVFFIVAPMLIDVLQGPQRESLYEPLIEKVFRRATRVSELAGIAFALLSLFFSVRGLLRMRRISREGEKDAGLIARLIARLID